MKICFTGFYLSNLECYEQVNQFGLGHSLWRFLDLVQTWNSLESVIDGSICGASILYSYSSEMKLKRKKCGFNHGTTSRTNSNVPPNVSRYLPDILMYPSRYFDFSSDLFP